MIGYSLTKKQVLKLEEKYYSSDCQTKNTKITDMSTVSSDPQIDQLSENTQDYNDVKKCFQNCQYFFMERFKIVMIGIFIVFLFRISLILKKQDKSILDIISLVALVSSYSFLIISVKSLQIRESQQKDIIKLYNSTCILAAFFALLCNLCIIFTRNYSSQELLIFTCYAATDILVQNWAYLEMRYSKRLLQLLMKIKENL